MSLETDLRAALLAAGLPITNVYAPGGSDRSAWQVGFGEGVTDDQRSAAAKLLASFVQPVPTPDVISDRQCFQQLAIMGKISQDEAIQAVTVGALPKVITDGIASLPAAQQFPARMMLCGATQFSRAHPMTPVLGAFLSLDGPGLDTLWRAGALL